MRPVVVFPHPLSPTMHIASRAPSAMETSFFVVADALRRLQPGISPDEESLLQAFDSHCEQIRAAATKVYKRGNKGSYELGPTDF